MRTAQRSVVRFAWLARQFQTVSLPAFARVPKVSCLFLTPKPLTPISLILNLVAIELCFGFMVLLYFFYSFSFILGFISHLWGAPDSINVINWRNSPSSCMWCADRIVRGMCLKCLNEEAGFHLATSYCRESSSWQLQWNSFYMRLETAYKWPGLLPPGLVCSCSYRCTFRNDGKSKSLHWQSQQVLG